jgi:uncharacterized membrane protein
VRAYAVLLWDSWMATELDRTESRASIAGHPIHPMLVPFPIAFLVGAFACDIVFASTSDAFWARAALWLAGAGLVMGALAAVFGLVDSPFDVSASFMMAGFISSATRLPCC